MTPPALIRSLLRSEKLACFAHVSISSISRTTVSSSRQAVDLNAKPLYVVLTPTISCPTVLDSECNQPMTQVLGQAGAGQAGAREAGANGQMSNPYDNEALSSCQKGWACKDRRNVLVFFVAVPPCVYIDHMFSSARTVYVLGQVLLGVAEKGHGDMSLQQCNATCVQLALCPTSPRPPISVSVCECFMELWLGWAAVTASRCQLPSTVSFGHYITTSIRPAPSVDFAQDESIQVVRLDCAAVLRPATRSDGSGGNCIKLRNWILGQRCMSRSRLPKSGLSISLCRKRAEAAVAFPAFPLHEYTSRLSDDPQGRLTSKPKLDLLHGSAADVFRHCEQIPHATRCRARNSTTTPNVPTPLARCCCPPAPASPPSLTRAWAITKPEALSEPPRAARAARAASRASHTALRHFGPYVPCFATALPIDRLPRTAHCTSAYTYTHTDHAPVLEPIPVPTTVPLLPMPTI